MNKIPIKDNKNIIKNFENINYDKSFKIYEILIEKNICYDMINYIIDVKHICKIGEKYNKEPELMNFNKDTSFKPLNKVLYNLL